MGQVEPPRDTPRETDRDPRPWPLPRHPTRSAATPPGPEPGAIVVNQPAKDRHPPNQSSRRAPDRPRALPPSAVHLPAHEFPSEDFAQRPPLTIAGQPSIRPRTDN